MKKTFKFLLLLIVTLVIIRAGVSPFWAFYKIPNAGSGGGYPTILDGDMLVVKKTQGEAHKGELMFFQYDDDLVSGKISYARVAAVAGDTVEYKNKQLWINGIEQVQVEDGDFNFISGGLSFVAAKRYIENLGGLKHAILIIPETVNIHRKQVSNFNGIDYCSYDNLAVTCKVPNGKYFMLGDNRDNSIDSRYRGFVSENQIIGKGLVVWANFYHSNRMGVSLN